VRAGGCGDGTGFLEAVLPVEHAATIAAVLDAAAHAAKAAQALPGQERTLEQLRADALCAPFLHAQHTGTLAGWTPGLAADHTRAPLVHLHHHHPAPTPAGPAGQPAGEPVDAAGPAPVARIRGFGYLPPALAARLAAGAVRTDHHHPDHHHPEVPGTAVEAGYRPSAGLAASVLARDGGCVHPSCGRTRHLHLDHTTPWPAGATTAGNLGALDSRHHLAKHAPGFTLQQLAPGHFRWTMPAGHIHDTGPPHLE